MLQRVQVCLAVIVTGLLVVSAQHITRPNGTDNWICFATSGGSNPHGGNINLTFCGRTCDATSLPWVGYIGALIAVICFGSNYLPVKKFDTGDGLFFQWVMCMGIWLVGVIVNIVQLQPPYFLPVFLGGFMWATGNIVTVPIIKMIGVTMGLTVWGSTNLLAGWISGKFLLQEDIYCPGMNYGGMALVLCSTVVLAFVKSEGKKVVVDEKKPLLEKYENESGYTSLKGNLSTKLVQGGSVQQELSQKAQEDEDSSWVDNLGVWPKRVLGFGLSLVAGFFFGFEFLPIQYMRLCDDLDHSCNMLDYFNSHCTSIFLFSTMYFALYCAIKRNKPKIYPRLILPAIASGMTWGVAMLGWFLANQHTSLAVSFPIVTSGSGFVSFGLSIILYKEIKGWRNIVLYLVAFAISLCGQVVVGLSSCTVNC